MKKQLLTGFAVSSLCLLTTACGGGGGGGRVVTPPPPPVSKIPSTTAITALAAPERVSVETPTDATMAEVNHVYRDNFQIQSPNGVVEEVIFNGIYRDVDVDDDGKYRIEPRSNGLSYFKVTNTKPNGSKRIFYFYGVPPGEYVTLDSTDIDDEAVSACKKVQLRVVGLTGESSAFRMSGTEPAGLIREGSKAYVKEQSICPLSANGDFMAFVTEETNGQVRYGFSFYKDLNDNDFIEVNIQHDAEMVNWNSDDEIALAMNINAYRADWNSPIKLFTSAPSNSETTPSGVSGQMPTFPAIDWDRYEATPDRIGKRGDHVRSFAADASEVSFSYTELNITDMAVTPLDVSWDISGADSSTILGGTVFNSSLRQSFAFMTMDPDVIEDGRLIYPVDDLDELSDGYVLLLSAANNLDINRFNHGETPALMSGLIYAYQDHGSIATDSVTDATVSGLVVELVEQLLEELRKGG